MREFLQYWKLNLFLVGALLSGAYLIGSRIALDVTIPNGMERSVNTVAHLKTQTDNEERVGSKRSFTLKPLGEYRETLRRPLFSESRQPSSVLRRAELSHPKMPEPPKLDFSLSGVVSTPEGKFALVDNPATRQFERISEGQVFRNWRVKSIQTDGILLENAGKQEELRVFVPVLRTTAKEAALVPRAPGENPLHVPISRPTRLSDQASKPLGSAQP